MSAKPPTDNRKIAAMLLPKRAEVVAALRDGRYSGSRRTNRFGDDPAQFDARIGTWFDLFVGHLADKAGYEALLAAQTILEVHQPERDAADNRSATLAFLDAAWIEIAGASGLPPDELSELKLAFDDVSSGIRTEPQMHVRTLLIGDCLMAEIAGLAANVLAKSAISFDPFPLNGRTPADLDRQIARLANRKYDAVFISPFSHARIAEIDALLSPKRALENRSRVDSLVAAVIDQSEALLTYLVERFDCPIYVHNAGLVARANTRFKAWLLNGLTARRRNRARSRINRWLDSFIDKQNVVARRLHLIDEAAIVGREGTAAGLYLYESDFQHATRLSLLLSTEYVRRIQMLATLWGKKLVICDLDETLWEGVIGEGSVRHFHDRQQILRRLKEKSGVVLTIASKNDPANVHFRGAALTLEDFVAPQISWGRKVDAVARLREQLNLQFRHMVFVDDRPDERAFIGDAFSEVHTVDASDSESWARLALWADATEGSSDLDRTQLYKQQLERDTFVGDSKVSQLGSDLIANLELQIGVRDARKGDLKRFVELINRTNQWNVTGARTDLATVQSHVGDPDRLLLLASARDKFGDMGDVCAAIVTFADSVGTIDAFVLSCRVFGYGVETAMIGAIGERAAERGIEILRGRFVATTQNHMARDMFADHGFREEADGQFVREVGSAERMVRSA